MNAPAIKVRAQVAVPCGFSLIEVLVALVVISIGLLGIVKMQALALSSTGTARMRALAAIEAGSLASTMRADRAYWASITTNPSTITIPASGAITSTDANLQTPPNAKCQTGPPCTSVQVAAEDLSEWVTNVRSTLPGLQNSGVTCNVVANNPVECTITLNWNENVLGINTSTNTAATAAQNAAALANVAPTSYTIYVDP